MPNFSPGTVLKHPHWGRVIYVRPVDDQTSEVELEGGIIQTVTTAWLKPYEQPA